LAGGFTAIENEEARQIIWVQEHKFAFEHSNLDVRSIFNRCQKCGKWVCNECYEMEDGVCDECNRGF